MKFKTKTLSSAIRLTFSLGAAIAVGAPGMALAQDAGASQNNQGGQSSQSDQGSPTKLQAVMVTGSHIRRVDMETANPVLSVNRETIKATGALTLGELVQDLPAMTGGATNPQVNNGGGGGGSQLSLRGLGPARTLILVDGHRVISSDVNSIPAAMIERIDVLKDGASAIYGSDAIGGVVNFITRKHFQGAQFTTNFGQSSRADARSKGYTFTLGKSFDKGSIVAGVGYNKTDGLSSSARSYSRDSLQLHGTSTSPPSVSVGGSSSSVYGHIQLPTSGPVHDAFSSCPSGFLARNPDASGMDPINDYHCYVNNGPNSDKYNFARVNIITRPQERTNGFLMGTYHLSNNVSVYLDAYYNKYSNNAQLAPSVYTTPHGVNISADNYYNPFGIEFSSSGSSFRARLLAAGPRLQQHRATVAQFSTGFKGVFTLFDQGWDWDVGLDYGHTSSTLVTRGLPSLNELYTGPSFLDPGTGKVTCGTPTAPIPGCDGSFNPFNLQTPGSAAALQNAAKAAISSAYSQERIWRADVNGGLFDLPAGTMQLALGVRYRQEHTASLVDPLLNIDPATGSCILGSQCTAGLRGGYNVKEAYGELFIPILSDLPFAYGLNVTIGDRYSKFSTFGSTNNTEFKVEWRPVQSLLLRGTVAEVFRAPSIGAVFGAPSIGSPNLSYDPCDGYTGSPVNPACVNVPTDGSFRNQNVRQSLQVVTTSAGSKYSGFPIRPESGKSFDIGAVYSPPWVPGLTVSVDAWHLYLNDIITSVGVQSLLRLCSAGQTVYCQFIHRYPSGPQQGQISPLTIQPTGNLGSTRTGGVDFSADYKLATDSFGRFNFSVNATYLKYYDQQTAPGTEANVTYHDAGHFLNLGSAAAAACPGTPQCLFPRVRGNGLVMWNMNHWHASWRMHYIGGFRMGSPSPAQDTHPAGGTLDGYFIDYGARTYHDIAVGYDIAPLHTRVDVGVNNLLDKNPPLLFSNNARDSNSDARNFDLIGRYYWARLTVTF